MVLRNKNVVAAVVSGYRLISIPACETKVEKGDCSLTFCTSQEKLYYKFVSFSINIIYEISIKCAAVPWKSRQSLSMRTRFPLSGCGQRPFTGVQVLHRTAFDLI